MFDYGYRREDSIELNDIEAPNRYNIDTIRLVCKLLVLYDLLSLLLSWLYHFTLSPASSVRSCLSHLLQLLQLCCH